MAVKKGKSLEKLVAHLEKALAGAEDVKIESPKKLIDKITGKLREHDVVITLVRHHHELYIAIECRDRSRPITVNDVEGFFTKCQHTGIAQGIIVSAKGFYKSAREKANWLGIKCLDLEQATSFDWLLAEGIHLFNREIRHTAWTLIPVQEIIEKPNDFKIVNIDGVEITNEILNNNIIEKFNQTFSVQDEEGIQVLQESVGLHHQRFQFKGEDLFIHINNTGELIPLKKLVADVEYEVKHQLAPFELVKYSDKDRRMNIADAAIATINVSGIMGKLMIIQGDKEGKIIFVNEKLDSSGGKIAE